MKIFSKIETAEENHFDKMALKYDLNYGYLDKFTKYKIDKKINVMVESLNNEYKQNKFKMLEIGCGTGEYSEKIASKMKNVSLIATDISGGMISVARKKCSSLSNIEFVKSSAYDMSFVKSKSIDVVCGFYILHHLDVVKTVEEIKRVLKPGGFVFFYEPNLLNPIVFLIKSVPYFKKMAGDSADEWAINPLSIADYFEGFNVVSIKTSEFVPLLKSISFKNKLKIENITKALENIWILKYLGGSVSVFLKNLNA